MGAFVGWAAFAVMGFSYWVLAQVGFPLRRLGSALAEATWWLMVVGVAGIVVSTLALHFAASWVFLYPLPFHSAGQWGEVSTGIFLSAVFLFGVRNADDAARAHEAASGFRAIAEAVGNLPPRKVRTEETAETAV